MKSIFDSPRVAAIAMNRPDKTGDRANTAKVETMAPYTATHPITRAAPIRHGYLRPAIRGHFGDTEPVGAASAAATGEPSARFSSCREGGSNSHGLAASGF
jgi:hypothetical protein